MDYSNNLEDAVKKFYSAGANDAHLWLLQFQISPEAWTYVWPLLEPSKPWEVQFFAATTLYAKISKQWNEVPVNQYGDLRNRLLDIMKASTTPKLILSRLCQGLAAFLINSDILDEESERKGLVDDLINLFPCNSSQNADLLLRVLSAIPDEFEKSCSLGKTKLRESLVKSWSKTTWLLQHVFNSCDGSVLESNDESLYLLALECAVAWLKMGQLPIDTTAEIFQHFLTAADRYAPSGDDSIDDNRAWEVVQDCLITSMSHTGLAKNPQLLWEWARGVVIVAQRKHGLSFCEILASLGDTHSRFFLLALAEESNDARKWTAENLVEILLKCSEHPGRYPTEERRSCVPFGFWYTLQDDLITLDSPVENRVRVALRPVYVRLALALLRKATLPSSPEEFGDADERELLRCYRQDAADTMAYCYNVLGQDLLILLGQRLSQPQIHTHKWTDVESTLHAFQALSDCIGTQENDYVPALMDLVLIHIPYGTLPREVLACACSTIGAYAEWIGENPYPWLERSLELVTLGLTHGTVAATPASMALKDISRECGPHLAPLAPSILETISRILPTVSSGGEGLRLMYAAGKLLNSLPSTEDQLRYLDATLGLCVLRLQDLLLHPVTSARFAATSQLKMATMFLSTLDGAMGKSVLDGLLPIFEQIVCDAEWCRDDMTIEAMHSCAQQSLQCLLHPETEAKPLLPILVASYKIRPHPAALTLLRQVVLLFGRDPENIIAPIFAEISAHSLGGFIACKSVGGNLSELADLLEAFLGLLAQICKKSPRLMLQVSDQIPGMLRCGITGLGLPESGVIKAAGTFLTHAVSQSTYLLSYIHSIGQELIYMIVECVGGRVARTDLEAHGKVLLALNNNCGDWTAQWLRSALEDVTAPITIPGQKEDFARNVLRERMNNRRMCETLQKFSLQCQKPAIGL